MGPTRRTLRSLVLGALTLVAAASAGDGALAADPKDKGSKPAGKPNPRAEKKACVEAHAKGQSLAQEGKYAEAREAFITCGREVCPGPIRKECAALLAELDEKQPTVVIEVRDEVGRPTTEVTVSVDGSELTATLDGRAIEVDPGKHSFRYVLKSGKSLEETVMILEGQRNRKLSAIFGEPPPPPPPPKPPLTIPVISYALGGVSAAALGSFAIFGVIGKGKQGDLEETCAPRCKQEDVDAMRTDYLIADVSLGISVVALGAAVYFTLTNTPDPPKPAPEPEVSFVVGPRGAGVIGRF